MQWLTCPLAEQNPGLEVQNTKPVEQEEEGTAEMDGHAK
jgi:hypothetical protein